MAIVDDNDITLGLRGRFGRFVVFKKINGKTYATRAPRKRNNSEQSEAQRRTRVTFREASAWAKAIISNPERKKYYQQRAKEWQLRNAYTAAIKEYMSGVYIDNPIRSKASSTTATTEVPMRQQYNRPVMLTGDLGSIELSVNNLTARWSSRSRHIPDHLFYIVPPPIRVYDRWNADVGKPCLPLPNPLHRIDRKNDRIDRSNAQD
jgi:hypothetical protein